MKTFILGLALLLLAAAPQTTDRFDALAGTWSCESINHSVGSMVFTLQPDGTMTMVNTFITPAGLSGEWDETFSTDTGRDVRTWQARFAHNNGIREEATGPRQWTDDRLTFVGARTEGPPHSNDGSIDQARAVVRTPLRLTYTALSDDVIRREIELKHFGRWVESGLSTCKRQAI